MESIPHLLGETEQAVIAALGLPFSSVPFGNANICFFKHAQVTTVEFRDGRAKRISYVSNVDGAPLAHLSNRRSHVRVRPSGETVVFCEVNGDVVHGILIDISSVGLALQVNSRFLAPLKQLAYANLKMRICETWIEIGSWVYRIDIPKKTAILFFLGGPDDSERLAINSLIEKLLPGRTSRKEVEDGIGAVCCSFLGEKEQSQTSTSV